MKILMLCDFYGIGQQYQENYLTKYYAKLGHSVTLIASTFEDVRDYYNNKYDKRKRKSEIIKENIKIIRLPYSINIFDKIRKYGKVRKILIEEKPDMIFVHGIHFNLSDAAWYKRKINENCRIILDNHSDYSNSANNWLSLKILNGIIRKQYLNFYKKYIDRIFVITPEGMKFMNEVYGISYSEMELLPLGCDYDLCEEVRQKCDKVLIRKKLNIETDDFVIITGGKLNQNKKTDILIDAIKLLNNPKIHLIIFGDCDDPSFIQLLKNKAEGLNVHFLGWLDEQKTIEMMNISDLAVYPACQSVLWQQSIGMYLPLIIGDYFNQDFEYLNKNNNIIVLPKKDIDTENLKTNIENLINHKSKLEKMKVGAKKTINEFLDYNIITQKTIDFK